MERTIASEYKTFANAVYRGQEHLMPKAQTIQIKQAFYGGAQTMFALFMQASDAESEEQGAAIVARFREELDTFFHTQRQLYEGRTVRVDL